MTGFSRVGATPIEAEASSCRTSSASPRAPSITLTKASSLDLILFGISNDNSLTLPGPPPSLIYTHSVSGTGPAIGNFDQPFGAGATPDEDATATAAGDGIGFQVGLSPKP